MIEQLERKKVDGTIRTIDPDKALETLAQGMRDRIVKQSTTTMGEIKSMTITELYEKARNVNVEMTMQSAVAEKMGFGGKPAAIVSEEEMDELVKQKDAFKEVRRGLSFGRESQRLTPAIEAFKEGELFAGRGIYGDGTYFDASTGKQFIEASAYADNNADAIIRAVLPTTAKIIEFDTASDLRLLFSNAANKSRPKELIENEIERVVRNGASRSDAKKVVALAEKMLAGPSSATGTMEEGAIATYLGYDAIIKQRNDYMVVLNRTALIIQRTPLGKVRWEREQEIISRR